MRVSVFANVLFGSLSLVFLASVLLTFALAHGGAQMECNATSIDAMNADIQAMNDGDAKTTATKEMGMAKAMMGVGDTKACMTHLRNAMEATEK